jgi:ribosomal protein L37AE/L43A
MGNKKKKNKYFEDGKREEEKQLTVSDSSGNPIPCDVKVEGGKVVDVEKGVDELDSPDVKSITITASVPEDIEPEEETPQATTLVDVEPEEDQGELPQEDKEYVEDETGDIIETEKSKDPEKPDYGNCPKCGAKGILRGANKIDQCENGHNYAMTEAVHKSEEPEVIEEEKKPENPADVQRRELAKYLVMSDQEKLLYVQEQIAGNQTAVALALQLATVLRQEMNQIKRHVVSCECDLPKVRLSKDKSFSFCLLCGHTVAKVNINRPIQ